MCGATANSREHKFKRSDLVRRYGDKPFAGGLLHVRDGDPRDVPGPNSQHVKYGPILCAKCNNETSQPWDEAYEAFDAWVFAHESDILARCFILLEDVFGSTAYSEACPALYKYFVKVFGCRLADSGVMVPPDLVHLLSKDHFPTKLRLVFSVNKAVLAHSVDLRTGLWLGDLMHWTSPSRGPSQRYQWHMQMGWFRVWFFYDCVIPLGLGSPWSSDSACFYLGECD
jgi:hypothetical protein